MTDAVCVMCGQPMASDREYAVHLEEAHRLVDDSGRITTLPTEGDQRKPPASSSQLVEPTADAAPPPAPPPASLIDPRGPRPRWPWVVAVGLAGAVALGAYGSTIDDEGVGRAVATRGAETTASTRRPSPRPTRAPAPVERTLDGTLTVNDWEFWAYSAPGEVCGDFMPSGYDDIRSGTQVVVEDGAGAVIAIGSLGVGETVKNANTGSLDFIQSTACVFPLEVPDVPESAFYGISITHRGTSTYSHSDLDAAGWTIALNLG